MTESQKETMKTLCVGVAGFFGTITLAQYSAFMAALTGTFTAMYTGFKCVDWILGKVKHRKTRKHHT